MIGIALMLFAVVLTLISIDRRLAKISAFLARTYTGERK